MRSTGARGSQRFAAKGVGSRELIVGTGKDDASDALDRRVEFKTIPCGSLVISSAKVSPSKAAKKSGETRPIADTEKARAPKAAKQAGAGSGKFDDEVDWGPAVSRQVRRYIKTYDLDDLLD